MPEDDRYSPKALARAKRDKGAKAKAKKRKKNRQEGMEDENED